MKKCKRIWINRIFILKRSFKWTGIVMSIIGFVGLFVPMTDFLSFIQNGILRIIAGTGVVLGIWMALLICSCVCFARQRRISVIDLQNKHHVYVQYGDVFSEDEVLNPSERRNIVIDFNRCFDTKVNDDLVSSATLHGKAVKKILKAKNISSEALNLELQKDLNERQHVTSVELSEAEKRDGNLKRYPAGTVAEYKLNDKEVFFFLGLSKFDYGLTAKTDSDEYGEAVMRLIEYIKNRSQGLSVVMPILGTGLAKTENDERDTLEYMIKALKLYRRRLNCDIHIVVWEGKDPISITDL